MKRTTNTIGWTTMAAAVLMAGAVAISGCGATGQARSVKNSGFLGDYSMLHKGGEGEALERYVKPDLDLSKYTKVQMDPIKVYPGTGDTLIRKASPEQVQKLVDYFDAAIREALSDNYVFVDEPGLDTLRIRVAITDSNPSTVPLDIASSVLPPAIALNALKTVATGEGTAVGSASAEIEIMDSVTGERLAAAVDKRVGNKYTGEFDKLDRFRATKAAFDAWAERIDARLTEIRTGTKQD